MNEDPGLTDPAALDAEARLMGMHVIDCRSDLIKDCEAPWPTLCGRAVASAICSGLVRDGTCPFCKEEFARRQG